MKARAKGHLLATWERRPIDDACGVTTPKDGPAAPATGHLPDADDVHNRQKE
ncbi:MAG TPA: hypothetical protein VH092_19610 [Urbifossiella sp.]|nr:hypothetical protein [Urbifossiella sp.]